MDSCAHFERATLVVLVVISNFSPLELGSQPRRTRRRVCVFVKFSHKETRAPLINQRVMLFAIREKMMIINVTFCKWRYYSMTVRFTTISTLWATTDTFFELRFAGDICNECSFDTSCISLLSYQIILTILAKLIFSFCLCVFCIVPLWLIEDSTPTPTNFCFILLYFSLLWILFSVIQNNPGLTLTSILLEIRDFVNANL